MNFKKTYFEELLDRDNEAWFIYHNDWHNYWKVNNKNLDLISYDEKGFVMINNNIKEEPHITFAYVDKNYRNMGVLKNIMSMVKNNYTNKKITLCSLDEMTDKVWESFGFKCIEYRQKQIETSIYEKYF